MSTDGEPRILISRLSAIGDCILTLPLLCALRRAFPKAMIAWVVQPAAAQLLQSHSCIDELVVVQRRWLKSPRQVWQLRQRLRSLRFDVTIDPQSLLKSATAAWLSGAAHRIGFAPPLGRELSNCLNNVTVKSHAYHVVDKHLELLKPLGIYPPNVEFGVPAFEAESVAVASCLQQLGFHFRQFAVLNPGTAWPSKRWPVERYAQLATGLHERLGLRSVIAWAGEQELAWGQEIARAAAPHAAVAPKTNLRELAAVLQQAALFVGSDTGPLHLAAAVGTSCVSLHGPTEARVTRAYGPQHIALQKFYQSGSARQRRSASNDALRAITVAEVLEACGQVWSALNQRSAA